MPNRIAISSMSLGRAWVHNMPEKLAAAARHGFQGVEIFYEDLEYLAKAEPGGLTTDNILDAAHQVRQLCDQNGLTIILLQPFLFYEGLLDRDEHVRLVDQKLPLWFRLVRILGTDLIQVPSNFLPPDPETGLPRITGDLDVIVADLLEIAELGLKEDPPVRFAYEALAWGTHVNTWDRCWEVVRRVDRPNFGICLDSFNIAGRVYADPAAESGKTPHAEEDMKASMARLRKTVDVNKVFYVQVVDAERLSSPLVEGHEYYEPDQPSRMSWSRNARLFPFEEDRGGYLPVLDVARAFFDLGFEGWVSLELFSRTMSDPDPKVPEEHARRGEESWKKLANKLDLKA